MKTERCEFTAFALPAVGRYALKSIAQDALEATESENCRCVNGKIHSGLGVFGVINSAGSTVPCEYEVKKILPVAFEMNGRAGQAAALVDSNGEIRVYSEGVNAFVSNVQVADGNVAICSYPGENGDGGVFVAAENGVFQTNLFSETYCINHNASNAGVCHFKERVFFSCGQGVRYSNAGDYTDFQESAYGGGYISVGDGHGKVYQLLACDDAVLLFKERSVFKLYAAGAADQFRVERLPYGGESIAAGSAAKCGKYVVFTASNGDVYRLDGVRFEKIAEGVPYDFCQNFAETASDGERYFRKGTFQTLVMEMDGSSYLSFSLQGLSDYDGMAVGVYDGFLVAYSPSSSLPSGVIASFFVKDLPLKDHAEKVVTKVTLFGSGRVGCRLDSERRSVEKVAFLNKNGTSFEMQQRGSRFDLKLTFGSRTVVEKIAVEFVRLGDEK